MNIRLTRSIPLILACSVPAHLLVFRIIDGAVRIHDQDDDLVWTASGQLAGVLRAAIFLLVTMLALIAWIRAGAPIPAAGAPILFIALAAWNTLAAVLAAPISAPYLFELAAGVIILLAVCARPPSRRTLAPFAWLLLAVAVATVIYTIASPDEAFGPCREDKCGVAGVLFFGFFLAENHLAAFAAECIPFAFMHRRRLVVALSVLVAIACVLVTGSRSVLLMLGMGLLAGPWLRRHATSDDWAVEVRVPLYLRVIPFLSLAVSCVIFLTIPPKALTGRGYIYDVVASRLEGMSLITGLGENALRIAYMAGEMPGFHWLPSQEHGEVPHLLTSGGVVATVIVALAFLLIALRPRWSRAQAIGVVALAIRAAMFPTEGHLGFNIDDYEVWYFLIVAALLSARSTDHRPTTLLGRREASRPRARADLPS